MFNIADILLKLEGAFMALLGKDWGTVKDTALGYLASAKQRLTDLAIMYEQEEYDTQFMLDRVKDEKDILLQELESFIVMGKAKAEEIANSIIDIFVQDVLPDLPQPIAH